MSDDLVKRARDCANRIGSFKSDKGDFGLLDDLADRIEALEAALAKADAALKECMDEIDDYIRHEYPIDHPVHERYRQRDFSSNPARVYFEARDDTR